jgi:hypothetical protein
MAAQDASGGGVKNKNMRFLVQKSGLRAIS